jgi:hypothetical protein
VVSLRKLCLPCGTAKARGRFNRDKRRSDGLRSACRACDRRAGRLYRSLHGPQESARRRAYAQANRALVRSAKAVPCADCDGVFPPEALDFDHLPGFLKLFTIGRSMSRSREALIAEIEKCQVVCRGCHQARTAERRTGVLVPAA